MKKILTFILSFLPIILCAQHNSDSYMIKQLNLEQGLSNSCVLSIAQDKYGFMWFATEEGLNKFDGSQFVTYYKWKGKKKGITGNELNCLLDDPQEPILWIGAQRCGLNAYNYDKDEFTYYKHEKGNPYSLITNDITNIKAAADGNLWISTYWNGVDYFNKKTRRFSHFNNQTVKGMSCNQVWSICDGNNGQLYIGQVRGGFSILDIKQKKLKNFRHNLLLRNSLLGDDVHCVFKDKVGNIWVGTDKGLNLFDPVRKEFISFANRARGLSNCIFDIRQFDGNKLWIATEFCGVVVMDLSRLAFDVSNNFPIQSIGDNNDMYSLPNSTVRCLFEDSYKNVWMGIYGGGIRFLTYNMPLFGNIQYSPEASNRKSLTAKSVLGVCFDKNGLLWTATDGGGINVFKDGERIKTINNLNSKIVSSVFCDSKGNIWTGLFNNGAYCMNATTGKKTFIFGSNKKNVDVRSFYEDHEHNIWICTSEGLYKSDVNSHQIKSYFSLTNNLLRTIIQDSKGHYWVGSFGGGLFVYDRNFKKLHEFHTDMASSAMNDGNFPSNTINQIIEDHTHRIWVATGEGLARFENPNSWKYKIYAWDNKLLNIHIRAMAEDKSGNIWVSTNKGISCLRNCSDSFYNYDANDNIPNGNFNEQSVVKGPQGLLVFGSNEGLCYFRPNYVLMKKSAPEVIITGLKVYNLSNSADHDGDYRDISLQKTIELSYQENSFDIAFNVKNYALADRADFAYMLQGLEDTWYTVKGNDITFRNLPYGHYKLLLKSRIRNQEWSSHLTMLEINVNPPLWLTWWAKIFYALLMTFFLYNVMRFYKRKVNLEYLYVSEKRKHEQEQELNDERLRFFTNITHELRTPLTLILGPLEDLMNNNHIPEKELKTIATIHQSAQRLFQLINQILEFRKTETQNKQLTVERGNIVNTIFEVGLKYEELNRNNLVTIKIVSEKEEIQTYYDKEVLTIVLDNLLTNSLKYTEKGKVELHIGEIADNNRPLVEIKVSDTGYGISAEALPHIFDRYYQEKSAHQASGTGIGLALVKNLVLLHEGEIKVDSQLGVGTTFTILLAKENTYPNKLHVDSKETKNKEIDSISKMDNEQQQKESSKPILLVVEDNRDIRDYIGESFEELFDVKTACDGREGLQMAFEMIPDIIVSDIMMPNMDGIEMCRTLKGDIRTSHIPIILLTAKDTSADKEEGYDSGADSYLTKPFSKSLLASRINNLLEQRKRLSGNINALPVNGFKEKHATIMESLSKLDEEFIAKMNHLIEVNIASDKIDIGYLSDNLNISSSTLYRKMKALTGLSTNEYVRKIKMKTAEQLLLQGRYTISEIAFKVGMNTLSYFRQCFKEEYGMLPSDYLKKVKGEP